MAGKEIEKLVKQIAKLPSLGTRSSRRIVLQLLKKRENLLLPLIESLNEVAAKVQTCEICGNFDTESPCSICASEKRDGQQLCVVQDVADLWAMERVSFFKGKYHVLGGVLSALDGIAPEDLNIDSLLARIGRRISFSLDSTASRAEHSLTHEKPRFAFFQMFSQRSGGKREAPQFDVVAPGVAKHEGELVLAPGAEPAKDAKLALRMAVAAGEFGLPINPSTLVNLKRCPIHDNQWDDESRELFIRLLACGSNLMEVWESIDFVDIPGRWMPEWLGVRNRPSASAAHRYTIDRHMVEVTSRLGRETPSGGRYDDDHFKALLLAGITHDIGKRAFVADHAAEGARHVPVILKRMGYAPDIVDWATVLVREHLTLSEFATGKDPYDPAVAEELADRLHHDKMLLDMLFDLTRADGSSLGATAGETITKQYGWSKWREQIVRGMYSAARAAM